MVSMLALVSAPPGVLPVLTTALQDDDPAARVAMAEVLGWWGSPDATETLVRASYDPNPEVRAAAAWALGQVGARASLPRLQQLQLVQSDFYVQEAAYLAEQQLTAQVAAELGLGTSEIQTLAVAPSNSWTYAVTSKGLYAWQGNTWRQLSTSAETPTGAVATNSDGQVVLLETGRSLLRSGDGGKTWSSLQHTFPVTSPARVTAIVLNPANSREVFVALAAASEISLLPNSPLGIFASTDAGETWSALPESPTDYVTTRLAIDPSQPRVLFGQTGIGTFRYLLEDGPPSTSG